MTTAFAGMTFSNTVALVIEKVPQTLSGPEEKFGGTPKRIEAGPAILIDLAVHCTPELAL